MLNYKKIIALLLRQDATSVGGQAVMEGIMMRNGSVYALAMRNSDGSIVCEEKKWYTLSTRSFMKKPFIRGCPILVETMINGVKALFRSAEQGVEGTGEEIKGWELTATLLVSLALALGLFVVAPHLFTMVLTYFGLSGDINTFTFQAWDGLFKFAIFISYIYAISFSPDIVRVFKYHGAEHKVIAAYESGDEITVDKALTFSRLHPRCGTTFLLFVLSIAIILHTIFVPLLLQFWHPTNAWVKHGGTIVFKILLMLPISAIAYELIRVGAKLGDSLFGRMLRAPGLLLQRLTTYEPEAEQVEVALVALKVALGKDAPENMQCPKYTTVE